MIIQPLYIRESKGRPSKIDIYQKLTVQSVVGIDFSLQE